MKKIIILIICSFTIGVSTAQKPVKVVEDSLKVSKHFVRGMSVIIPEASYEKVLDSWIKVLQSNTRSKAVNKNGEVSIFGARSKDIADLHFNVYSILLNQDSAVYLAAAFELSKDEFVGRTSTPAEYKKASEFLNKFAIDRYTEVVKDQYDAEDKKLKDLEKELSKLENEHAKLLRSIESNNEGIVSEKSNIAEQQKELDLVSSNLAEQNNLLAGMEEGTAKNEKADFIKDLDKRKKKARNSISVSEKKIAKSETEIEEATQAIPGNETSQDESRQKIAQQQIVYEKFLDKYKKVKAY